MIETYRPSEKVFQGVERSQLIGRPRTITHVNLQTT